VKVSAPFIRRPIATLLAAFGVLLLGLVSYSRLPIAALPSVERPTIVVSAQLPGASANTLASSLTLPLERELGVIPGIVEMVSSSTNGSTQITVQFDLEKDIEAAAGEVQAAINAASPNLPKDIPAPPTYYKANPSGFPVIALALNSDVLTPGEVYDYADSVVVQKLSEVSGVGRVFIYGAERSAVRIQTTPRLLANMNVSLEKIRTAVQAATQNIPKGSINIDDQSYAVRANDQLIRANEYRDLVVAWRNGAPVRLSEVAQVTDSVINDKLASWYGDRRSVLVFVYKQPTANVVEIVDTVKAALPQLAHWLPAAIKLHVVFDRTTLVRASISDVQWTIAIAIALVFFVIPVFLKRLWPTLIPGITIPVVLAGVMIVMHLAGYSLDNLTLMAITISIGFIIDDAVIIVENITRLTGEGKDAITASLEGTSQMGFTIISISGALLGALLPILFMPDVVGRYFREFGVTLGAAIVVSAIVSLTLTPMLCSRPLAGGRLHPVQREDRVAKRRWPLRAYLRSLDWILTHSYVGVAVLMVTFAGGVAIYAFLPKGFMPTQDTGILSIRTITVANVSFSAMSELQRSVARAILQDPAVDGLSSYIGAGNGLALGTGTITVNLKPLEERQSSIQDVITRLREQLATIPGIRTIFRPLQDLNLGAQNSASRYQYTMTGPDPDELFRWSDQMRQRMRRMPQLTDVVTTAETSGLEAGLVIDRHQAAAFGVTPFSIDNALYDAFGQRQIKTIYLPFNFSRVILEVDPASQTDPTVFQNIYVRGASGNVRGATENAVPLSAFTQQRRRHGAVWMNHSDQFPSVTLSFDTRPDVSIGDAIAAVRAAEVEIGLPADIKAEFRGEAGEATKVAMKQLILFLGALFAVYVVLGILYESWAHPFTILTTLPSTTFGALLALELTKTEFTLVAAIACILVVGIVMKNAIIMVDFALAAQRRDYLSASEAIRLAAKSRVRPVVMTSLVAILSAVPLAIGTGPGHELRQPLGIATVGGLLVSQVITLYTTPVVYLLIDRLCSWRPLSGRP
jgi:hydrophobe/amphiphile efflux-1 (HAE1) family protein